MLLKEKVDSLLQHFFESRPDLFLISCKISPANQIEIIIDGDQNVSIQDCLDCSRSIENNLDREEEDFELSVYSSGLSNPLELPRQYKKNIGQELKLITQDDKEIVGDLIFADDEKVILQWKERQSKTIGKGKETVIIEQSVEYKNIKKAVISIKF